ncbi:hypothetical protein NHQ30_009399 [Ciborinia camelliae]|nr:hypothetical protein NHQ30_009399 [Ciborinia camelliae]
MLPIPPPTLTQLFFPHITSLAAKPTMLNNSTSMGTPIPDDLWSSLQLDGDIRMSWMSRQINLDPMFSDLVSDTYSTTSTIKKPGALIEEADANGGGYEPKEGFFLYSVKLSTLICAGLNISILTLHRSLAVMAIVTFMVTHAYSAIDLSLEEEAKRTFKSVISGVITTDNLAHHALQDAPAIIDDNPSGPNQTTGSDRISIYPTPPTFKEAASNLGAGSHVWEGNSRSGDEGPVTGSGARPNKPAPSSSLSLTSSWLSLSGHTYTVQTGRPWPWHCDLKAAINSSPRMQESLDPIRDLGAECADLRGGF